MSKYNKYARKLDEAFRAAREEYSKAWDNLKAAEQRLDLAQRGMHDREEYRGDNEARLLNAQLNLNRAKHDFELVSRNGSGQVRPWDKYEQTVKELTKELTEEVNKDYVLDPDQIDRNAIELLKSGVMTGNDYTSMAEKFSDNMTMKRLIKPYIVQKLDTETNLTNRAILCEVLPLLNGGYNDIMDAWKGIVDAAYIMHGRDDMLSGYPAAISQRWDDDFCQTMIEEF